MLKIDSKIKMQKAKGHNFDNDHLIVETLLMKDYKIKVRVKLKPDEIAS